MSKEKATVKKKIEYIKHNTKSIVFSYIHHIQQSFPYQTYSYYNIPKDINLITFLYIDNYFSNKGRYQWKIDDPQMVNKMLNCACGDKFVSNPFKMARLKWQFEIYPNGDTQ